MLGRLQQGAELQHRLRDDLSHALLLTRHDRRWENELPERPQRRSLLTEDQLQASTRRDDWFKLIFPSEPKAEE